MLTSRTGRQASAIWLLVAVLCLVEVLRIFLFLAMREERWVVPSMIAAALLVSCVFVFAFVARPVFVAILFAWLGLVLVAAWLGFLREIRESYQASREAGDVVALAIKGYAGDNQGKVPGKLDALVPDYLPFLPRCAPELGRMGLYYSPHVDRLDAEISFGYGVLNVCSRLVSRDEWVSDY